jgi:tetratricopeptide (TPR) repeat protein
MMAWTGKRKQQFREVLVATYPDRQDLRVFVMDALEVSLNKIAKDDNLDTSAFELIEWADSKGRLDELLAAFCEENPHRSAELQAGGIEAVLPRKLIGTEVLPAVAVWHGRDALLSDLAQEFNGDRRVIALLAQGGMGKSALMTKLVEAAGIDPVSGSFREDSPFDRAIAIKTYEGTSFDEAAAALLTGLGIGVAQLTTEQTIAAIVRGLARERVLLIFDNLEVILQPPSHEQAGRAISRDWGMLLDSLANGNHRSLTILTSRELPADLAGSRFGSGKPNSRLVRVERLDRVDAASAVQILRDFGLQDSEEDLVWMADRVGGHPFSLELLSRHYADRPGYLRRNAEILALGTDSLLEKQVARQSEAAQRVLALLSVLRCPIDGWGLTFLRLFDASPQDARFVAGVVFSDRELAETEAIVEQLTRASLVQAKYEKDRCENLFSLHRVVVEFTVRRVDCAGLWAAAFAYYRVLGLPESPQRLEDLQSLLEAQQFAFLLGNYGEAESLIYKLEKYLNPWGYWALKKELCEQVLPHLPRASQPYISTRIGSIYRDWGDWNQAETYYQQALDLAKAENNRSVIANLQGQLGTIERNRGNWDEAERLFRQSLELQTELGDRSGMATSWGVLGDIENYRGNYDKAEEYKRKSFAVRQELGDKAGMASSLGAWGDIERKRGNWDEAERLYRQSLELRTELGDRSGMASSWGALGDIERNRGNWDEAEGLFTQMLKLKEELGDRAGVAESHWWLMLLAKSRKNIDLARHHYTIARDIFTQLGAAKNLENLETGFNQ